MIHSPKLSGAHADVAESVAIRAISDVFRFNRRTLDAPSGNHRVRTQMVTWVP